MTHYGCCLGLYKQYVARTFIENGALGAHFLAVPSYMDPKIPSYHFFAQPKARRRHLITPLDDPVILYGYILFSLIYYFCAFGDPLDAFGDPLDAFCYLLDAFGDSLDAFGGSLKIEDPIGAHLVRLCQKPSLPTRYRKTKEEFRFARQIIHLASKLTKHNKLRLN